MGSRSDPGPIPPRWLNCPRKSNTLVASKFLAFKTPLDEKYDSQVPAESRFSPEMLIASMKQYKVKIGLWIDLTNTSRFYNPADVERNECKYVKLSCRGHGETPSPESVKTFISICRKFIQQHPLEIVAVHCTHGFNRTGFLISAYLIEEHDWSIDMAVADFAAARPPGIYKEDYLKDIYLRYGGDAEEVPPPPELPDWCFEEDTGVDEDGEPSGHDHGRRKNKMPKRGGKFMEGVPGVTLFTMQPKLNTIQRRIQDICGWKSGGFPGCQPVSMSKGNLHFLAEKPYKVSWKADGTRYMMYIGGKDEVYFADRDNCIYHVKGLTFLNRKTQQHLYNTLLDGEMVIDTVEGQHFPRYLVYDIIRFEEDQVGQTNFGTRLICIDKEIVGARNTFIKQGLINKAAEPFSIRKKEFWDVSEAHKLIGEKFKANLSHEPDGLIFQPFSDNYKSGVDESVLKWKPLSMNSVDFRLKIVKEEAPGCLPTKVGQLFVGSFNQPLATMKVTKDIKEMHNKIIECKFENGQWVFMRERTDKSFPNSYSTAMKVMETIRDPVTEEILFDFIEHRRWRRPVSDLMPPPRKQPRLS